MSKLTPKQKAVIQAMREGYVIHWMGGLKPSCFLSGQFGMKLSTATTLRLEELNLIERASGKGWHELNDKYLLTNLGKSVEI